MSSKTFVRHALPFAAFIACAFPVAALGQSAVMPRIVELVDSDVYTRLHGNLSALARPENDRGEASPSTQLNHLRLILSRSADQQVALDSYKAQLMNKSSPNYRKWLTPEQFGKLYGPADSDIAAITGWLESQGLKVEEVSLGRTNIAFSGSVAQVEATFHTQIHSFEGGGQQFLSNNSNPSIPKALANVVTGVGHLSNYRPRPYKIAGRPGKFDAESKQLISISNAGRSEFTPELTTGGNFLYIVPGDAATIYDTPNSFNANFAGSTSYTGAGVTIGVGGDAVIQAATFTDFRAKFIGDSATPLITNVDANTQTADTDEAYIDTELAGGLAPGATIHFYTSTDLVSAINKALNDNAIDIFSLSFGECELDLPTSDNVLINGWWEQAAMQGIAVAVSTGDSGSAGCDATQDSSGNNITAAAAGLAVSGYASTPNNIAIGGTDLVGLSTAFSTYANTANSTSATMYRSALSYIPESTWNDSTTTNTTLSANIPLTGANANIVAASGGASSCSVNTDSVTGNNVTIGACTSGYTKPSWQRGTGVPADSVRDIPDVSLMAGNGNTPATWLVCTDDTFTQSGTTYTENCVDVSGSFAFAGFGGTSTAAPSFAGILALVQQKTGARLGQAAKDIYDIYNSTHASAVFHDTTVGNISVPCTSGSPNCAKNTAGNYYETGYNATTGYDFATGLGSVDAAQLINFYTTAVGTTAASVSVVPSATSITNAEALTVAATVTGASGTPTGTVTLSSGSYNSGAQALTGGAYTFSVAAGALPLGTDTLTVAYSGDPTYATTTGSTTVTVTEIGSYSLAASTTTAIAPGASTSSTITATPAGGYTGSITLTCSVGAITGGTDTPTCSVGSAIAVTGAAAATGSVTVFTTAAATSAKKGPGGTAQIRNDRTGGWLSAGGAALACLLFFGIPARRRNWKTLVSVLIFTSIFGALSGCGGGGGGGGGTTDPGTTAGTYTVTVTGTDAALVKQQTSFTVTVN